MANHPSAKKRSRASERKRSMNRTRKTSMKTAVKNLRSTKDKKTAEELLSKTISLLDKLAEKRIIHKNKSANLKSKLTRYVKALSLAEKTVSSNADEVKAEPQSANSNA